MAQDVALMSFCLAAMNTADLYFMEKDKLVGNKLCYNRHKTEAEREDGAYTEVAIPKQILPLIKKYEGKERLFKFSEIYKDNDYFNTGVNKGLKQLCKDIGIQNITTYTLRHSWATIAQNQCGASTELVGFALNHASAHRVTEGYITKDYSPIDKLNKKVIDFVFKAK
jgi:integrase